MVQPLERENFKATGSEWVLSAGFLLSLALVGLGLWPFYVVGFLILVNRYFRKKEEFIVELFILCTYSGFLNDTQFPIKFTDILLAVSIVLLVINHAKSRIVSKVNYVLALYIAAVILLSLLSEESLMVQMRMMRYYFLPICYIIPVVVLRDSFDLKETGRMLILYSLVIGLFYVVDCFIFNGWVLVPQLPVEGKVNVNSLQNLLWAPFTTYFPRKMPQGLFIFLVSAFFMARMFKLNAIYWIIILLAFVACRTMTFLAGTVAVYLFSLPERGKLVRYLKLTVVSAVLLYFVDVMTGGFLRVSSTVEQFKELNEAVKTDDIETLAEFGSGRIAQIYPKMEELIEKKKLLTGFGFLHPSESSAVDLMLRNELYKDGSEDNSIELPAQVEVTQVQTILHIGIIGLILQIIFYIWLIFVLKKYCEQWLLFTVVLIGVSIAGLGGFVGLTTLHTLWIALALGLTCLTGLSEGDRTLKSMT